MGKVGFKHRPDYIGAGNGVAESGEAPYADTAMTREKGRPDGAGPLFSALRESATNDVHSGGPQQTRGPLCRRCPGTVPGTTKSVLKLEGAAGRP